jgi:hypothetical protein
MVELLTPKDVVDRFPILAGSVGTLANWRSDRIGPRFFKIGRKVAYRAEDIEAYLLKEPVLTRDSAEASG